MARFKHYDFQEISLGVKLACAVMAGCIGAALAALVPVLHW